MNEFKFESEYETEVFINGRNTVTVLQIDGVGEEAIIVFESKKRALDVAKAISRLAKVATFKKEEES